jgi:hypothetical protein
MEPCGAGSGDEYRGGYCLGCVGVTELHRAYRLAALARPL